MSGRSTITSIKDEVDTAWFGTILDASSTGIAISINRRLEPGTSLIVELLALRKGVLRLPVRVVHARQDEKERWVIGCALVVPGSSEEDPITYHSLASPAASASRESQ
jgi:hypothetical protein